MILKCSCGENRNFVLHENLEENRVYVPADDRWRLDDIGDRCFKRIDVYCRECKREWTIFGESHRTLVLEEWEDSDE